MNREHVGAGWTEERAERRRSEHVTKEACAFTDLLAAERSEAK